VGRLSSKCGNLDVSQPYGPPRTVTGIALPFFTPYIIRKRIKSAEFETRLYIELENIQINPRNSIKNTL
jgi:hypothetical protein